MIGLILAATIGVQPIAGANELGASLENEVVRALDVAATNRLPVSAAMTDFIRFHATNGWSVTRRAIELVSTQKDGRWFWQGAEVTPAAVRMLERLVGRPAPPPQEDARAPSRPDKEPPHE